MSTLKNLGWRGLGLALAAPVLLVAALMGGPLGSAASAASCRWQSINPSNGLYYNPTNQFYYTDVFTVPPLSVSTCNDINVTNVVVKYDSNGSVLPYCAYFRVRIFPNNGDPSYTGSWHYVPCPSSHLYAENVVRYNVPNGTRYRIETFPDTSSNHALAVPEFSLVD